MRRNKRRDSKEFSAAVGRALRRAAKVARKTARMHGTPIYIWNLEEWQGGGGEGVCDKFVGRNWRRCLVFAAYLNA